jgi:hypothetical protein
MPSLKKSSKPTKEVLKRSQSLETKKRVGKIIIISVLAVLLLSGLGYLLYLPALSVRTVSVQGNSILDSEEIIGQVDQTLAGKYWQIFPKRSIFIYPKKVIITNLLQLFPRLATAEVGLGEWDSLVIDIKERDSDSIWCKSEKFFSSSQSPDEINVASSSPVDDSESFLLTPDTQNQNCYFADDDGFIFAPAPYFSNSVFIELSGLLPDQPLAQKPLSTESYSILTHFAKSLSKIFNKTGNDKYRLIKVKILDQNNYEAIIADTSKVSDNEWVILFNNDSSAEELTNNLYTVLNSDPFTKEMLKNGGDLSSVDLRYGKKVFYKFK